MTIPLSPEAYVTYIRKHARWNFRVNVADLTFYNFALSFIFGSTVLPLYVSHLTSTKWLIGLIPAIQSVGYFIPQLLSARYSESLVRKKPFVVKLSIGERFPYLFVTLCILLWPGAPKWFSFALLAFAIGCATLAGGLGGPGWNGMLAKVIPPERRGQLFGLSNATGGLLGMAGAFISQKVLADPRFGYPLAYGLCFLFCFFGQVISWICLTLNREPPQTPTAATRSPHDYLRYLPTVLHANPNFARYLGARVLLILGFMGTTFYIIYAKAAFQINDAFAGNLTFAALATQMVCAPLLGWLSDHRGHKWLTEVAVLFGIGAVLVVLLAPGPGWFYLVFVLLNIASSGTMLAGMSLILEFSDPAEVPTYSALANTLLGLPILVAPLFGGWLADAAGFRVLFITALVFTVLGWSALHWGVREPRQARLTQD